MQQVFSQKQLEFIENANAHWNIAHGSVRAGKTECTLFIFMYMVDRCPDSSIAMIGHTSTTIYENAVRLILNCPRLAIFRPYCTWFPSKRELHFKDKVISTIGAKDEGSIGLIQGRTLSLVYCDEMTLYPLSIIDMIDTRLSNEWSKGYASMNPTHPKHKLKEWIDKAAEGDKNYYSLHFTMEDNPFLPEEYIERVRRSMSGVNYKRHYLGLWCLAAGAIFDFFDTDVHVVSRPPTSADYWIAGIDYGTKNAFCCLLIGVSTGRWTQTGKKLWVEKEYYWDQEKKGRQKTNSEYARDVEQFLDGYNVKSIYIDPSAEAFQLELRRKGMHTVHAYNDVENGIQKLINEMSQGNLVILDCCSNLIREIEGYVWDSKAAEKGFDEPLKKDDHACVTGETLISTCRGNIRIDELVKLKTPDFLWNCKYEEIYLDAFMNVSLTREDAEVYELELEDGTYLIATGDHQIYTHRGYIALNSLNLCDTVLTCNINYILKENSI